MKMKPATLKILLLAAPLWFALIVIVAGAITPNYSHVDMTISELAAPGAPLRHVVMYAGFVPVAGVLVWFGIHLFRHTERRAFAWLGLILFGLAGLAVFVAGVQPTDLHGRRESISGVVHAIAGIILLMAMCTTPPILSLSLPGRTGFRVYSFITALVLTILFILIPNGMSLELIAFQRKVLGSLFDPWYAVYGLHQRLLLLIYFAWVEIFAACRLAGSDSQPAAVVG
jgi:hypothetical membrane protein